MFRIGLGHDTHRLIDGDALRLGGVDIPHTKRSLGHSDADALLHAVADALLGAAALGDIGEMFPDTDPTLRGKDSADILRLTWQRVAELGWKIVNLDCIVFAEQPKISPYKDAIRRRIAEILEVDVTQVGLKAKTGEQVGPIGRQEAIAAECVVLLNKQG
jgi:2-C-methyl-D-erythritol 2,4-cyclodiphosphate synthase